MRYRLLAFSFLLFTISCSDSEDTGFSGDWVGETTIIVNGNPTTSETRAAITDLGGASKECEVFSDGQIYIFDATEDGGVLTYDKSVAKNIDSLMLTLITGEAQLVGDTLLRFVHQIVTMDGNSVLSSIDYDLEFKRAE